jgi:hypothetical protein
MVKKKILNHQDQRLDARSYGVSTELKLVKNCQKDLKRQISGKIEKSIYKNSIVFIIKAGATDPINSLI